MTFGARFEKHSVEQEPSGRLDSLDSGGAVSPERKALKLLHDAIVTSQRYVAALSWGTVRQGHPEALLSKHLDMLHDNLRTLFSDSRTSSLYQILSAEQKAVVSILIDAHDTLKPEALVGVPIAHPKNHASLASSWLRELGASNEICVMAHFHDESHALFRQSERSTLDQNRLSRFLYSIPDWDTFFTFQVCDKVTPGRNLDSIHFLVDTLKKHQIDYHVPAELMIQVLCEKHQLSNPRPAELDKLSAAPSASTADVDTVKLVEIHVSHLPAIQAIRAIESTQDFDAWLQAIRQDILSHPERYYGSTGATEDFLVITTDSSVSLETIRTYVGLNSCDCRAPHSLSEIALAVLEKVRN